ncbi:hypothetical protein T492DRAFT_1094251 [Pavlovales sp. CCMP2436]|nr:hypothetical protein T492DRAFT_1094251 [Pavlovales sp. CCMP2436]
MRRDPLPPRLSCQAAPCSPSLCLPAPCASVAWSSPSARNASTTILGWRSWIWSLRTGVLLLRRRRSRLPLPTGPRARSDRPFETARSLTPCPSPSPNRAIRVDMPSPSAQENTRNPSTSAMLGGVQPNVSATLRPPTLLSSTRTWPSRADTRSRSAPATTPCRSSTRRWPNRMASEDTLSPSPTANTTTRSSSTRPPLSQQRARRRWLGSRRGPRRSLGVNPVAAPGIPC